MSNLGVLFGIQLLNVAAQSPWSNGTYKRLNQIQSNSVKRITEETNYNTKVGLAWTVVIRYRISVSFHQINQFLEKKFNSA